jgi:hypothetical protein
VTLGGIALPVCVWARANPPVHDTRLSILRPFRRSLSGRRFMHLSCVVYVSLVASFPACNRGAGRSLIIRDSRGHSVVPCRHVAAKPAPRGPLPPAGCSKSMKKARILQIYGQITGLKRCIFPNKYVFLEHKGTTAGQSPEPGRPLERLHGFPVLCIFSSR